MIDRDGPVARDPVHPRDQPAEGGMASLPAGGFLMGSDRHYLEEAPVRQVGVKAFRIDRTPVTNRQFADFVKATGYVTTAEQGSDPLLYAGFEDLCLMPGALVFRIPRRSPAPSAYDWWEFREKASWRRPDARRSVFTGRLDHPVTCVTSQDAEAYAAWAGKRLPTEAEWEYAARGGLEGAEFSWGDEFRPEGRKMANVWYGEFPFEPLTNSPGTSCVGSYAANGFGLQDMIGNIWEWTSTWYSATGASGSPCCGKSADDPSPSSDAYDPALPTLRIPRRVVKGGSFLCAPNFCARYRPAARQPQAIDTAAVHIGFRCAQDQ
jgi:sulfatase modifying factor 1